jgi:hypothetical protein
MTDIIKAIDRADAEWRSKTDQILMIAQGEQDGEDCILVKVKCDPSDLSDIIPSSFMGYPVTVFEGPEDYAQ